MQNAANSVVGRCVVQFARVFGFKTLNVVRSREGVEEVKAQLRALGADVVLTDAELEDALPDAFVGLGGRPVLGLNAVGGASVKYLSQSLRFKSAKF